MINCATVWYTNLLCTFDCFTCPLPINPSLPGLPLTLQTLQQIDTAAITIKKWNSFRVLLSSFTGGRISSQVTAAQCREGKGRIPAATACLGCRNVMSLNVGNTWVHKVTNWSFSHQEGMIPNFLMYPGTLLHHTLVRHKLFYHNVLMFKKDY